MGKCFRQAAAMLAADTEARECSFLTTCLGWRDDSQGIGQLEAATEFEKYFIPDIYSTHKSPTPC